eukprot:m.29947 g.29947  ORF g.29947 m.29947 type:complete len:259 (+) comp11991_c0_seq1:55-831(+)
MLILATTFTTLLALRLWLERLLPRYPAAVQVLKVTWYIAITSYEYSLLTTVDWLPAFLGGASDAAFWPVSTRPELDTLYQLSAGYHSFSLVTALMYGAKFEMHLHHAVTVALIALSNWLGFRQVGAVVMFLHDAPDIFSSAVKGAIIIKHLPSTVMFDASLLISWAYFRLYLFALLLHDLFFVAEGSMTHRIVFGILLTSLYALQWLWYVMLWRMLYRFLTKGDIKDTSEVKGAVYPEGHEFRTQALLNGNKANEKDQ